jgi:hypothetical protein
MVKSMVIWILFNFYEKIIFGSRGLCVCVNFLVPFFALFVSHLIFLPSAVLNLRFPLRSDFQSFLSHVSFSQQGCRAHRYKSQTKFWSSRSIFLFTELLATRSASVLDPQEGCRPRVLRVAADARPIHFSAWFFRLSVRIFLVCVFVFVWLCAQTKSLQPMRQVLCFPLLLSWFPRDSFFCARLLVVLWYFCVLGSRSARWGPA